ncbi:MAG: hypothetical protein WD511_01890 [Balneolaceae bacterium]
MTGCKTTLQSNWKNFNAYYNTFYNAKKSYDAGLKKNLGQARDYNPLQPIRIHPKPVNAGAQDFDKAIEKAADVLRKYDDTKWVDDALELIGKSYYFKQEYFSANQKFKELFATTQNPEFEQQAIVWQARVLLDMELFNEGTSFITEQLTLFEEQWEQANIAEIKVLLAQHYVQQGSWELARMQLSEALPHLSKKEYKERGYFLLGQVYERLEDISAAYDAYDKVQDHYVEYRLQYLAKRKKAEVARDLDRHDVAFSIFSEMVRDDKNIEYKAELDFELAQTEQRRGNFARAENIYKNLLRNQLNRPSPEIAARTYYGLADIYRFEYDNFSMAAAYYDSAAQKNVSADKLPEGFAASELAESFGEYSRLKSEIALKDSLLWLGQLSPEKFDSVVVELRAQKAAELERLKRQSESQQNTVVNVDQESEEADAISLRNGFLNSDNPVLQQNAKMQFLAYWGDRPLADNWRVSSMIRVSRSDSDDENGGDGDFLPSEEDSDLLMVELDLSGIPFTKNAQDSVRKYIAAHQYQLGNLFFLSLDIPDSAAYYFKKAVENPSQQNVNVVSLYSLSELYSIEENDLESRKYADELINKYPASDYARRVSEKFDIELRVMDESASIDPMQVYNLIMAQDSISASEKAEKLKSFSKNYSDHKTAPKAQYDAIRLYMEVGKQDSLYEEKVDSWIKENEKWEEQQETFQVQKDTAQAMLQDTTLTEAERAELTAMADSSLIHPDFTLIFPYTGEKWDSARSAIDVYLETFQNTKYSKSVSKLQEELKLSGEKISGMDKAEEPELEADTISGYTSCNELEAELEVRGGMDQFIASLNLPEQSASSEVTYGFLVNQRGIIDEYTLITELIPAEITDEFEAAFESALSFEPVLHEGQAIAVQCELAFPLEN